jgi:hypothetical protein
VISRFYLSVLHAGKGDWLVIIIFFGNLGRLCLQGHKKDGGNGPAHRRRPFAVYYFTKKKQNGRACKKARRRRLEQPRGRVMAHKARHVKRHRKIRVQQTVLAFPAGEDKD